MIDIGEDEETADSKTEDGIPEKLGEGQEGKVRIEATKPKGARKRAEPSGPSGLRIKAKITVPGLADIEVDW